MATTADDVVAADDAELEAAGVIAQLSTLQTTADDAADVLEDGSRVLFTRKRRSDDADLVHFVMTPEGRFAWTLATAVDEGEPVFDEAPVVAVSTLDGRVPDLATRAVRRLFPGPALVTAASLVDGELHRLGANAPEKMSGEWLLTYLLLTRVTDQTRLDTLLTQMRKPGKTARVQRIRAVVAAMPHLMTKARQLKAELDAATTDDDRQRLAAAYRDAKDAAAQSTRACSSILVWINAIRRRLPATTTLSNDDILVIYGIVTAAALHMTLPLSGLIYGTALYTSASHLDHSCSPTAVATFGDGARLTVTAARPLAAGTRLSIDRYLASVAPFVRCIQTAPAFLRDAIDAASGERCCCDECRAALDWYGAPIAAATLTLFAGSGSA